MQITALAIVPPIGARNCPQVTPELLGRLGDQACAKYTTNAEQAFSFVKGAFLSLSIAEG